MVLLKGLTILKNYSKLLMKLVRERFLWRISVIYNLDVVSRTSNAGQLVEELYEVHQGKKEILLWCNVTNHTPRKRACSPESEKVNKPNPRYTKFLDKMTDVEATEAELREKHADGVYTEHQLRSWVHLIQMKKHSSYDTPPDKPFWRTTQRSKSMASGTTNASLILGGHEGTLSRDSPGK